MGKDTHQVAVKWGPLTFEMWLLRSVLALPLHGPGHVSMPRGCWKWGAEDGEGLPWAGSSPTATARHIAVPETFQSAG